MTPPSSQRVLVTAGASGIGLAIARAFVADGARVHIADIDAQALDAATAVLPGITTSRADVSNADDVERLMTDVERALGGLDALVNNAGVAGPTMPASELDPADWDAVMSVNLKGTFLVTRRAIPLLKGSPAAAIVVMSSLAGRFGYANRIAYATSKWGLVGFTKTLSLELGPLGITCNTILPGPVDGDRIQRVLQGRADLSGRSVSAELDDALANQAIKRLTPPSDIAAMAVFLAGPGARSISGQAFPIDGDSRCL
jgi:NAD(P)-dependent dehydrogenase (short-subunit alcohol dehydrogenase family)